MTNEERREYFRQWRAKHEPERKEFSARRKRLKQEARERGRNYLGKEVK